MSKRFLLAAAAGVALVAFGGTAVALAAADPSPSSTAGTSADPSAVPPVDLGTSAPSASPTDSATGAPTTSPATAPADSAISVERAKEIALARTGDERVTDVELETEHGRTVWEVETVAGGVETEVHVDAQTGDVTRERDDNDDNDDDDDDNDDTDDDDADDDRHGDDD